MRASAGQSKTLLAGARGGRDRLARCGGVLQAGLGPDAGWGGGGLGWRVTQAAVDRVEGREGAPGPVDTLLPT